MVNDSARVMRRPRRASPRTARTAAAIIATAVMALLASACGGSPSPTGSGGSPNAGGSASSSSAVGFSACIRSHGVPNYPDPGGSGVLPKTSAQQLGVSTSQYEAAQHACQHLLPVNSASLQQCEEAGVCSHAEIQQWLNDGLRFARCMRSHGVPNWPDPTVGPQGGGVAFAISVSKDGFDPHSPQIEAKVNECDQLMPAGGVPLAVSQ
jgi:hypothetical protein